MEDTEKAKQPYKSVVAVSSNKPYIIAAMVMAFIAVTGTVLIQTLRPEVDNTAIIIEIFGYSAVITTGLFTTMNSENAARKSQEAATKSQETHMAVNSRLDEYKEMVEALALAQGIELGKIQANARTDMLAQQAVKKPNEETGP